MPGKRTNTSKRIIFPHPPSPVQVSCKMFKPVGSGERAPATTTHSPAIVIIHTIPRNHIGPAVRGKTLRTSWGKAVTPGAPPHMSEPIQLRFDGRRHSIAIHMYDVSVADELRFWDPCKDGFHGGLQIVTLHKYTLCKVEEEWGDQNWTKLNGRKCQEIINGQADNKGLVCDPPPEDSG